MSDWYWLLLLRIYESTKKRCLTETDRYYWQYSNKIRKWHVWLATTFTTVNRIMKIKIINCLTVTYIYPLNVYHFWKHCLTKIDFYHCNKNYRFCLTKITVYYLNTKITITSTFIPTNYYYFIFFLPILKLPNI